MINGHFVMKRETRTVNVTATIEGAFNSDKDREALVADLEEAGWKLTKPSGTSNEVPSARNVST